MDQRTELQKNNRLRFPGMECVIDSSVGRGSNVMAYIGHYGDHHNPGLSHRVLIRELFPFDPHCGIFRDEEGGIHVEETAREIYELNRLTFLRGNEVHLHLAQEHPEDVDTNINTFEYNGTLYSLLGYTGGRNLEQELDGFRDSVSGYFSSLFPASHPNPTKSLLRILRLVRGALEVLGVFHDSGYLHLDVSPDNILLIGRGERERVTLIDYNSVHTMEEIKTGASVFYSIKDGYTAPEVRRGSFREIGTHTDLYSMTAVLYRCVAGKRLTSTQLIGTAPLELSSSPLLEGCSEPALDMLLRILKRGLAVTIRRRYRAVADMVTDLLELEDRINHRGITHWALWENGRSRLRQALKDNTALDYVRDDSRIYPIMAETEDGSRISLLHDSWITGFSGTKKPVLLLGGGGMGKTTALLRIGSARDIGYSAATPVLYYVSLYRYREDDNYICNRLLESLRYKEHTEDTESARQELMNLLDKPLRTPSGPVPSVILLLDGLNEAAGDTTNLLEEIHRLACLSGVQIILTSRSDPGDSLCHKLTLCRLEQQEVRRILSKEGILLPESMEVVDLLSFPMLLSMYIRMVRDGGKQLQVESREQLLEGYFDAILEKERRDLPDDTPAFTGLTAAVRFLLPEIAVKTAEKQRALTRPEMLSIVEGCYRSLSKKAITAVYPDWIGHLSELRLGTNTADDWYRKAVLEILWKRLGLLLCDEQGCFRVIHQIIEDHLAEKSRIFHEKFDREVRRQRNWHRAIAATAAFAALSALLLYFFFTNRLLEQRQQKILRNESIALASSSESKLKEGRREEALKEALDALPSPENKRPYVASAERALADALYLYQEDSYHETHLLKWENELVRWTMDQGAKQFIAVDQYGRLFCLDCRTGRTLWESSIQEGGDSDRAFYENFYDDNVYFDWNDGIWENNVVPKDYNFPVLRVLEKSQTVFCAGEKGDAVLLSLSTGEEIWRINYKDLPYDCFDTVHLADVSHDEETLVLGILDRHDNNPDNYSNDDVDYRRILLFFDMKTGKMAGSSEFIFPGEDYMLAFTGKGVFSQDDRSYIVLLENVSEFWQCLVNVDVATGKVTGTSRTVTNDNGDDIKVEGMIRAETADPSAMSPDASSVVEPVAGAVAGKGTGSRISGTYYYLCEYDSRSSDEGSPGTVRIGFLPDGSETWKFNQVYNRIGIPAALPEMQVIDGFLCLISGTDIVRITQEGLESRVSAEKRIVYACRSGEKYLYLVFEDGRIGQCDLSRMSVYIDPEASLNIADTRLTQASGPKIWKEPFCVVSGSDTGTAFFCEYLVDNTAESIAAPQTSASSEQNNQIENGYVFPIPGDRFLVLYSEEDEELSNPEESKYIDKVFGTVYNSGGEVLDSFSFLSGPLISDDVAITADGTKMLCGRDIFDLNTHSLVCIEDILPDEYSWLNLRSAATKDGILSACWGDGRLLLYKNAESICESRPDREFTFADAKEEFDYSGTFSFEQIITGSNGLIILLGTEGEEVSYRQISGKPADYFLVYSMGTNSWKKIPNAFGAGSFPTVCAAENEKWFAAFDKNNRLLVYNGETGEIVRDWPLDMDILKIETMRFVLDDKYLLIQSQQGGIQCRIVRLEDGETVFTYHPKEEYAFGNIMIREDRELQRLYLSNGSSNMTGACVDSESWEILFEIPALRCVPDDRSLIIFDYFEGFCRKPIYSCEDLIKMGNKALNPQ